MKILPLAAAFASLLCYACNNAETKKISSNEPVFNEQEEVAAILKVIEQETNCFFDGDYSCWANTWSHATYALQAWNNDDGTYDAALGWDKINKQGKEWIEKYYANGKNIVHPMVKKEKPVVKFFNSNTAYLIWKQYNADKDKKYFKISQETRLMEKQADGWKIVNVTALWNAKSKIPVDSIKLD
jgi:hypothetical protein